MNDDQLDDLKQFIVTTVGQSEVRIKTELKSEITSELKTELGGAIQQLKQEMHQIRDDLTGEIHSGFASIGDITARHNDELDDHETRLKALEPNAV